MGEGASLLFDIVAVVFLVLTLLVGAVVVGVATDAMDAPILAPDADDPLPTQYVPVTLTPSPVPGMEQTPGGTPTPDAN
jgi:hypothetical protein